MSPRPRSVVSAIALMLAALAMAGCITTSGSAPYPGEVIAYHAAFTEVEALEPVVDLAHQSVDAVDDLPLGLDLEETLSLPPDLIISPGNYTFEGRIFQMEEDGLYRFLAPGERVEQRVVWDGDVETLLSSVAWIYTHGKADDGKEPDEISEKAMQEKIRATCGSISTWIGAVLQEVGVASRVVTTLTLDEWNQYDNGHTMIEVWMEEHDQWVVYDLDQDAMFTRDGDPLSFLGFVKAVDESDYEIVPVAADTRLAVPFKGGGGFDYTFFSEFNRATEENQRAWYERVIQVPLIERGGDYWFYDEENRERIGSYGPRYKYTTEQQWMAWFYPDGGHGL